jgi:glycine hydroxymethyltransferase
MVTSGIRLGTPAVTSRGFNQEAMREIAEIIDSTLTGTKEKGWIRQQVSELCNRFPLYS